MRSALKGSSKASFSVTDYKKVLSKSQIIICTVMLPLVSRRSDVTNGRQGSAFLDTLEIQSMRKILFEREFGGAPVTRKQVTRCIILFSAPIKMRMKYVDCAITVIIVGQFV